MPPKQPRARSPAHAEATKRAAPKATYTEDNRFGLRPSGKPGVWLNSMDVMCDANGVALGWVAAKLADAEHEERVLGEPGAGSPARYMKSVALDPTLPTGVRLDAAKAAAPYFDRKQPQALDGGLDPDTGNVLPLIDVSKLAGLTLEELTTLRALLLKGGGGEEA